MVIQNKEIENLPSWDEIRTKYLNKEIDHSSISQRLNVDKKNVSLKLDGIISNKQMDYALEQLVNAALEAPSTPLKNQNPIAPVIAKRQKSKIFRALDSTIAAIVFNSNIR